MGKSRSPDDAKVPLAASSLTNIPRPRTTSLDSPHGIAKDLKASLVKSSAKKTLLYLANNSRTVRNAAAFITRYTYTKEALKDTYAYFRERFVRNGKDSSVNETERKNLVKRFELIDSKIPIATTPTDGLFLAEMLLNVQADGDIVECGCYAGGSTAKLSIVANLLGRKLIVCDSFEGLPAVEKYYLRDQHCRRDDKWVTDWAKGRFAASLEEVQNNVKKHGEASVCKFVRGWFSETLNDANLPHKLSFAFVDVTLANSAKDCFVSLWPRLSERGIFVTHDAAYIKVLQEFYNPVLWKERFQSTPGILFGAGFGLCNESPHLGYMVKGESLSSEYLKALTIDK
jgi:O-methyltransferase